MEWEDEFDGIHAITILLMVYNSEDELLYIDKNLIMYGNDISHQQSNSLVRIFVEYYDKFGFSRYIQKFLSDIGVGGSNSLNSCIESYERSRKITEFLENDI